MGSNRRSRFRLLLFLATGLGAAVIALTAYFTGVLRWQELATINARFSIRGAQPAPKDVVVVGIDDDTFNDFTNQGLADQWPFSRYYHARVIDQLRKDGAKVIAYDIQFTERSLNGAADDALVLAVRRAGNVVLAATEVNAKGKTRVFGGPYYQRYARAQVGDASYGVDPGATIRRVYYAPQGLTSFPVAAAGKFLDTKITEKEMGGSSQWIDFVGPPGTIRGAGSSGSRNEISFSQVYFGKVPASVFRGKVVVVGPASATLLGDVHATSTTGNSVMTGVEVEASAIETALEGFPLRSYPRGADILLIILLALIPSFTALKLPPLRAFLLTVALAAGFAAAVQFAFNHGRIVGFVYPLVALVLSAIGSLAVSYMLTAFERERTRNAFERFVPEGVVNQVLLHTDEGLRLGGARVFGTCMFTDLRGSTQFAESLPPETVVEVINRYLGELTEAILGHGGTLISYLGDGFMAVFGAPIEQDDHADRAVAAAREILGERLPRFNEWLREQGHGDDFRIGVGLNTGPFMAGNVGSEKRLEYTAMGDTINTASRLEGLTKNSDFYLLMADSSREALVRPLNDVVPVGEVEVRGREGKLTVWSLEAARKPVAVPVA